MECFVSLTLIFFFKLGPQRAEILGAQEQLRRVPLVGNDLCHHV